MLKRSAIAGLLAALSLVALSTNAEAATLKELFAYGDKSTLLPPEFFPVDPFPGGALNTVDDLSEEQIIQRDGNETLDVGDSLEGILDFNKILPLGSATRDLGGESPNSEFSGIFRTMVIGKHDTGLDDAQGNPIYQFAFGPDPEFEDDWGAGAMVVLFEDTTPDYDNTGGPGTDEPFAMNGTLFWVLGFLGDIIDPTDSEDSGGDGNPDGDLITDLDEGWIARALDAVPTAGLPGTSFGEFSIAMNRILSGGAGDSLILGLFASNFGGNGPVQFLGSGQPLRPNANSGWPVSDNTRLDFRVLVPLPAAAWAGIAMLGLLGVGRKLRRRSA